MNNIRYFLVVQFLFSLSLCEINNDQKEKFLSGFLKYYNSLPNQVYHSEEGSLQSTQQEDDTTFKIEANLKVAEISNNEVKKSLKCTAVIKDSDNEVTVLNSNCEEAVDQARQSDGVPETSMESQVEVTEPTVERKPVQLVNEVQQDTAITSGEQFIAIPRDQPRAPCIGCASHVNPQAAGVSDLAGLGVRHLDLHEPSVKHSLANVIDVERQVQVVNGVRYILTLSINFNNCTQEESENCATSKICKITILVKPWVKLTNGGNYRAILANNCTEEWQFGDNGEVLPEPLSDNNQGKEKSSGDPADTNAFDDDIQVKHDTNLQSQPNQEKTLSEDDIKKIQEQIITDAQFQAVTDSYRQSFTLSPDLSDVSKQHVFKVGSEKHNENSIPVTESQTTGQQAFKLNVDKKKAIDEMLDFFDFAGFKPKTEVEGVVPRVRRSYDYDLQVLSLAEDYHGIKNSIQNARFMYEMAQAMVDYMNEMDMEVKNRAVKNVIRAEEEKENLQRFVYIQARVTIPCDKVECEPREVDTQICNGVIDCINENNPQILSTFCYNDNKESDYREDIREVALNDPVLRRLAEEAAKQIESESKSQYAMRINKIASAITQVTSGTLTKFSVIIENIKCNKTVPLPLRENCTVLEQLGSKICDVIVHERHWLKEKKMSYTCTDRPADMRISKSKTVSKNITVDDPQIIEMLQEAIQYLESQSDKTNKQKIVSIKSITSQIIAGFLTKIEFVVGYTDCTDENYSRDQINKCELLKGEGLRLCKAQIWDRSWIMDGRQIEVSCDDVLKNNEILNTRKKRSIDSGRDHDQQSLNKDDEVDYKKLANESLYKFMQSSSSNQHYEVVKVDKTMIPDVSRKLIKIEFSISPTNCLIQSNGILSSSKCNIVNPKNILHCRSKILENNWIDKKQYFVKCNIKYQQQKINTIKERNPTDSKYYQLAAESLKKYLHDTGNPPHSIVRVEKVTTQIVAGLLTTIDFIISPKNLSNSKTVRCHSEILEKHWMGTKSFNVSCQLKQDVKKMDRTVEIHADNPKYMQIAVESLQKYIRNNPESNLVRVAFVDKVERKSEKLKIRFIASHAEEDDGDTLCYAEVTETKESKSDIEVKCHLIGKLFIKADITEDDPNYYKYVQLADESLRNYIQKMNTSLYTVVTIGGVAVLWDEGIKTLINFTISPVDTENTDLLQGKQCITEILEQPWLQNNKNIHIECKLDKDLYRTKREASNNNVLGGLKEQNPSLPEYKALAEESLRKYIIDSGIRDPLAVAQVEKVTTQVVAGSFTRIDFLVSGSPDANLNKCHSEVWEQKWRDFKEITVTCANDVHRNKRQVPGGTADQDPSLPEYKALAEESLRKYIIDSGIRDPLVVTQVEKVTTQVVAGSLTRIDFLVSGSPDANLKKCHSEVWEQKWRNFKEITVTCANDVHRNKRQVPGGTVDHQDPSLPEYKALAEESLRKYIIDSGIRDPLVVAQVEKVTTQVVAGSLTRIDFLVSGSPDANLKKCHSEVWEQKWRNFKEITVTCANDVHRNKRQVPGGTVDQDPSLSEYKALAEESLRKYIIDSGIRDPLVVAQVEKVTTQVVAGSLTRIDFLVSGSPDANLKKCHSEVWEQKWRNFKEITVTCANDVHRNKRQVPGGTADQDPSLPEYKALAEESLRKYIIDSGIRDPLVVTQVEKVTTQVVAGSLTRIDFLVSGSPDANLKKCHSEVWEQKWRNFKEITVTCANDVHRNKRQVPGGTADQDPSLPEYKALAEESLRKYIIDSGIRDPLVVTQVEKVTTQVVAGSLTRIDFLVSGSPDANLKKCHSEVWEQKWRNFKEITVTCANDVHRNKRQVPGGTADQDPSLPEYKALAEESLRKYIIDSGIRDPLVVTQVEKVTTQVVAGSLTRIDFLVSGSPDANLKKCHSEVWEQKWRNFKEITVTCANDVHRNKRQVPGGTVDQDPTKPEFRLLADESLRKYIIDSGIRGPVVVAQVVKVTTQVVAGSLTRIDFLVSGSPDAKLNKCHSEVWEQKWRDFKEITVTCENDDQSGRRQILGGLEDQDPTKSEYRLLAEESLRKHIVDHNIKDHLVVLQVQKVTTQTVAGTMTRIDFLVSGSPSAEINNCHSEVWTQEWKNFKQITVTCENDNQSGKIEITGGQTDQDPTETEYRLLAEESLRKHIIDHNIKDQLVVLQVQKVTTQVVAGIITRLDFLVSSSPGAKINKCHSEVWTQEWKNFKQITVTCENDNQSGRRQILGGLEDQDPTKSEYRLLAEESLRKHIEDHNIKDHLVVLQVQKVTTQTVAGTMTRIDFLVSGSPSAEINNCHSEVWTQEWKNFKQITVTCENDNQSGRRQILGGLEDQDPTKSEYRLLAEESLRKHIEDHNIKDHLVVLQVQKVTTQTVAGTMTRIDFLVSGSPSAEINNCHSEVWTQEWKNFKQITVTCENDNQSGKIEITGGQTDQDPTETEYRLLAEESLRKHIIDHNIKDQLVVLQVQKVTTQVVAGIITRLDFLVSSSPGAKINKCHSEVWTQEWKNFKQITVTCENDNQSGRRQILGGLEDQDPTKSEYRLLAEESLRKHIEDHNIKDHLVVLQVQKVTTQTVAGTMTRIDFLVSGSPGAKINNCHSEVWTQEWKNFKQITVTCENDDQSGRRQILGGLEDQDPTKPEFRFLAEESLRKYIIDSGIRDPVVVAQVVKVTTQVVAGSLTRIDFLVSGSPDANLNKCHSEVWEQKWRNFKEITVTCANDVHRNKRQVPGGTVDQDPTKPEFRLLADESLRKYIIDSGIRGPLVVAQVVKVTTQVVAGSLTRIDFLVSGSPDAKLNKCHSEVWEQKWRDFKEITVTCENDDQSGRRQILGGLEDQDPTKSEYRLLAEESLRKHIVDHNIKDHLVVLQVQKVTTQTVAGTMTRIDFLVSGSPSAEINNCHSEVWTQEWKNFKQITVTCENDNQSGKIEITGGQTDQDPTETEYRLLAEESLRKHIIDHNIKDQLVVLQVQKVTTQVVAGIITRLDFLVSSSPGAKINKCHSEVWTQEWKNFKQITVTCENDNQSGRRQILGGLEDQDPTKSEYRLLAEESLRKHIEDHNIKDHLVVLQVQKVTTQTVAGTMTRIDFLVSGSPSAAINNCHSEVWTQEWINFKQITVTCENDNQSGRRQILGGLEDQDPTKSEYRLLAEESLRKHIEDHNIKDHLVVLQVQKVTTQTVAGTMTRIDFLVSGSPSAEINNCHSEVWTQEWKNFKQITVTCENDNQSGRRQILGGLEDQDPTKLEYRLLAEESLRKHVIDHNIKDHLVVLQVQKVTTQVVAGTMTRIDFLVTVIPGVKINNCHSEIWTQEWKNFKQIAVTCKNDVESGKIQMIGGETDQDPTKPEYILLAEESLRKHIIDHNIKDHLLVLQVQKVTTQVVAGTMTRIDFLVSGSPGAKINKCHSEVWTQEWKNFKQITVTCENDNQSGRRQILGGIEDQDPTKPKFRLLAEESLRKYTIENGIKDDLVVVQVKKVTTQVVAGIITRIDFLASRGLGAKINKCHSEVLTQEWKNLKQITVTCEDDHQKGRLQGGIEDQDPTKPKFRLLAEESLRKYTIENGIKDDLVVVQVKKVTTQVVAGLITRIDFLASRGLGAKINKCHSEVLTQEWKNLKQITVTCEDDHQKGHLQGGIEDQDPTKSEYRLLAEESLRKHIIDYNIKKDHLVVLQVDKVTTQVVAGIITRIDFLASGFETLKCHSRVWQKPWNSPKEIIVTCKRLRDHSAVQGGLEDQDPTKPEYKLLAEQSLQKYRKASGITQPLEVLLVKKVFTQVVNGFITRIDFIASGNSASALINCHSKIWDQGWINHKDFDVACRDGGRINGDFIERDPTEPVFKELAEEAMQNKFPDPVEVDRVRRVMTKFVSGMIEIISIDFTTSSSYSPGTHICHIDVLEQFQPRSKKIENFSCLNDAAKDKSRIDVGPEDQDPTKPEYRLLAEESLRKHIIDHNIKDHLVVLQVQKVTTQVVAGAMTRIDFLVSGSPGAKINKCHSEIWTQGWRDFKQITVTCPSVNGRVKRDLGSLSGAVEDLSTPMYKVLTVQSTRGDSSYKSQQHVSTLRGHGEEEQDPTKPEYKQMAEESLRKLYQKKSTVYHTVLDVQRVFTRVVSGLKYKIDFTAAPTACSVNVSSVRAPSCKAIDDMILYCHSEIWDKPWLKQKKIDAQCNDPNNDNFAEDKSDNDLSPKTPQKSNVEKYIQLAEEASEKYLTTSNRKYVHKVTEILSSNEQVANDTLTNINFTISPTTCLRNETTNNSSCKLKQPLVVFNCNANIRVRQLQVEKEVKVTCKKVSETKGKRKSKSGVRAVRQIGEDDDEIDEDTAYYYADRAVQHINDRSHSNNLHKLISIYAVKNSVQMGTMMIKMYITVAETYCLRHQKSIDLKDCEEMSGLNHRLCLARLWPSPDDELVVRHVSVVCDDEADYMSVTGVNLMELIRISLFVLESPPENKFKLVHQGEPQLIPSLDSRRPFKLNLVVGITNCSKDVNLDKNPFQCFLNPSIPPRNCYALIWLKPEARFISNVDAQCTPLELRRQKRSALDSENGTDYSEIQSMVKASLEQLEMQSLHRYKQRVLQINSHSTKITSGKVTTIDFDVGYTSCLKYEWVGNITSCNFLEHLPRRRCVAQIWQRLWINNGKNIDVNCVDDETPLESHIEFESAEMANELARQALKHIEAKYPHPAKQKVVRIFSLEKQVVAGIHYKMKIEVGFTDCVALSEQKECTLIKNHGLNKFCRVNVWIRPWTDHPPNFRVKCDYQEGNTHDLYHQVQAEHLFYNFLTTYSPSYVNNYSQMHKRFEIFKNNIKKIHEFNVHEKGTAVYGVTRFTDLTYEEFRTTYMGLNTNLTNENQVPMKQADIPSIKVPENFDWRDYDAVTEVKDQGSCGSCWAFSVTGNIEGQWKMQSGQLVSLSEQELVDCDKLDDGCNGGLPDNAYRAIEQLGGLELESDYPYEGTDDKCAFNKTLAKVQISSAVNITANETGMAQWLVHNGPISIGINANAMQFYMGGISHPWKMLCNPTNLDHGVLIVGYGIKDYPLFHKKLPYWIIKNSWGKSWGEQGYYRVYRGDGTCGVNQMASSAVI